MITPESEIIQQLKRGDREAFHYIYRHHYPSLCQIAFGFLKDDFLAETIVGDVIFNLYEKKETLQINSTLRGYLMRAVRNRCINYLEQEHIRREVTFGNMSEDQISDTLTDLRQEYPLGSLLEKELEGVIEQAVNALPKECRQVLHLSRYEGKSNSEIAETLSISVSTVKYHLQNAVARLRKELAWYLRISLFVLSNWIG